MNIINFIIKSSVNPQKISLTLKGILGALATLATIYFGFADVNIGSTDLNAIVDIIVSIVQNILLVVSGLVTAYGLIRKLYVYDFKKKVDTDTDITDDIAQ